MATQKMTHPKGLYMLFAVEMWERFSYYGMRAILALFMASPIIGFTQGHAGLMVNWFQGFVYMTPVIGGYIADNYLGRRKAIILGAVIMALGQFTLASYGLFDPKLALFSGLALLIIGNGLFKPNISTIVGDLYEPNDHRRDSGFTIFYMGINLGAFFAPFVCGTLAHRVAWRYGFMAAGVGLIIGLVWFILAQDKYLGPTLGVKPTGKVARQNNNGEYKPLTQQEWDKIKAILVFSFFAIFFWAFYEQAATSLTFFADNATRHTFMGIQIDSTWFQSVNPLFIFILAPIFSKLWIKMGSKEPTTTTKFAIGLALLGTGYILITAAAALFQTRGPVSALWLVGLYFLHTNGELCLSPVGLSMVTKLSPAKFVSMFMGVFMLSNFLGNILAGWFASFYNSGGDMKTLFMIPAVSSLVFALLMFALNKKMKQWMHGVK